MAAGSAGRDRSSQVRRPKPLPWLKTWLSDDGDIMVDRSTTIHPLEFLRI